MLLAAAGDGCNLLYARGRGALYTKRLFSRTHSLTYRMSKPYPEAPRGLPPVPNTKAYNAALEQLRTLWHYSPWFDYRPDLFLIYGVSNHGPGLCGG